MDIVAQFATGAALGVAMGAIGAVALLKGRTTEGVAFLSGPVLLGVGLAALFVSAFALEGLIGIVWATAMLLKAPFRRAKPGSWWFDRVYTDAKRRSITAVCDPLPASHRPTTVLLVLWAVVSTALTLALIGDSAFTAGWFGALAVAAAGTAWVLAGPSTTQRALGSISRRAGS